MPRYAFRCVKCGEQFERRMSIGERERARPVCPKCKGRKIEPVYAPFFAKTSRKA